MRPLFVAHIASVSLSFGLVYFRDSGSRAHDVSGYMRLCQAAFIIYLSLYLSALFVSSTFIDSREVPCARCDRRWVWLTGRMLIYAHICPLPSCSLFFPHFFLFFFLLACLSFVDSRFARVSRAYDASRSAGPWARMCRLRHMCGYMRPELAVFCHCSGSRAHGVAGAVVWWTARLLICACADLPSIHFSPQCNFTFVAGLQLVVYAPYKNPLFVFSPSRRMHLLSSHFFFRCGGFLLAQLAVMIWFSGWPHC